MKNTLYTILFMVISSLAYSQQLIWSGSANNNDFFDEGNWKVENTTTPPAQNTINPNQPINATLIISNVSAEVTANGIINVGNGSLNLTNVNITAEAISGGNLLLNLEAYLNLTSTTAFLNKTNININSGIAWIRTLNLKGAEIENNHLNQIKVNNQSAYYTTNLRLDNYYLNGTVIRSNEPTTTPLTIYDEYNIQGGNVSLGVDVVHSGSAIPNNMNNKTKSFILKKGYMATFAISEDGTGKSKNYIASESDLVINELPTFLVNDISFVRVLPWNWVNKKGVSSATIELNNTWNYLWANTGSSTVSREYAPMAWGAGGANDDADIVLYKSKYKATHVLAFNESDNCNDQSGQYNNLCQTDVAVGFYKNLMKTGLRLVSPSGRENAPFGWLKEFHDKANAQDIRIDVIGVHWYDWGASPSTTPNADPMAVFNRFKKYLDDVYKLYKLPIWITEFNANPNRSAATNYGFMLLALPYLESLDYIERYCWFQPSSGVANYYNASGSALTNVGIFYRDQVSTPAIPDTTFSENNNLDIFYNLTSTTIEEIDGLDISIVPNPTQSSFKLTASDIIDSYQMYNHHGQIIMSRNNINANTVNVQIVGQNAGIYFVILRGQNGWKHTKKVIIQ
jgi:hypothetical protein